MELSIALTVLLIVPSNPLTNNATDNISAPTKYQLTTQKRESPAKDLNGIQQKLTQHGQVMEDILVRYKKNEDLLKRIMEHFSLRMDESKQLDKVEVFLPNRRSSAGTVTASESTKRDTPIVALVRFGMNIRKYGRLFADVISNEVKNKLEPILEVITSTEKTRRSSQENVSELIEKSGINQWCSMANECNTTILNPTCGFDKQFGLTSKFNSVCHMLQTNCYWGYDFNLVSSCEPNV